MLYIFSKVIHDMQVKGTAINESLVMWQDMKEGKTLYSHIKRYWFFNGPVSLDSEFHKYFSVCLFVFRFVFLSPLQVGNNC